MLNPDCLSTCIQMSGRYSTSNIYDQMPFNPEVIFLPHTTQLPHPFCLLSMGAFSTGAKLSGSSRVVQTPRNCNRLKERSRETRHHPFSTHLIEPGKLLD